MNYCILNGKKSTLIKGLMIQSLPSISKPLMRTSIERIDGRDGDIVTELGYSAYDKTMSIGLFGDYDIDEIIRYFDSEGTVIFSNEPDKFYRYKVINQIDFERLIRFRTATVTFHVQPFKYSAVDNSFEFDINQIRYKGFKQTLNGCTVTASLDGFIRIVGNPSVATEFFIPIQTIKLNGLIGQEFHFTGKLTTGWQWIYEDDSIKIRLIDNVPDNEHSFGGTEMSLKSGVTSDIRDFFNYGESYNYIWMRVLPQTPTPEAVFEGVVQLTFNDENTSEFYISNMGNTDSKPIIKIYGQNNITLLFRNNTFNESLDISLGSEQYITIDTENMNAYKGSTLKNRLVSGDLSKIKFPVGRNRIYWRGTVTKMIIENASRWI